MLQLCLFSALWLCMGAVDLSAMRKTGQEKEMIPYCILMAAAGAMGLFYFSNPFRQSIAYWIFKLLNLRG